MTHELDGVRSLGEDFSTATLMAASTETVTATTPSRWSRHIAFVPSS